MTKVGVLVFPGSNCDCDYYDVIHHVFRKEVEFVWHQENSLKGFRRLLLPGGFSYGDYLRCGAIARFSPVMKAVRQFADDGGFVRRLQRFSDPCWKPGFSLGRCCATGRSNLSAGRCIFGWRPRTPFTRGYHPRQVLKLPIAHGEGNYYADAETLERLKRNNQIVFRYSRSDGTVDEGANPNGSVENTSPGSVMSGGTSSE
jgi:phosphoribosylformylglycinamidine synthase